MDVFLWQACRRHRRTDRGTHPSLSPLKDRQPLASWLFYESLFTWKLYNSRGLISISGDSNWFVRLTNQLDVMFDASLRHDTAVDWLRLGAMLCEELSPFVEDSDAAKDHLRDLQQRLQDNLEGNPEPSLDYSIQIFNSGAVKPCLRWMQRSPPALPLSPQLTPDTCHFRGQEVCPVHDTDPHPRGPHSTTDFLAYWACLGSELRDGSVPAWFKKLKSSGIRPTKLLAMVVRGWEVWFEDSDGNARSVWKDEEIIKEVKSDHVVFRVSFFENQILKGDLGSAFCRSAGRELVRAHLAVTLIPG